MSSISGRLQPKSYKALKLRTLDYYMHPRKENIYATNSGKGVGVLSFKIHDVPLVGPLGNIWCPTSAEIKNIKILVFIPLLSLVLKLERTGQKLKYQYLKTVEFSFTRQTAFQVSD